MKILLHACCGPCACYPLEILREQGHETDVLFYNPNIHPYKEFKARLAALEELCRKEKVRLYIDKRYELETCLAGMLAEPGLRCAYCYRTRLEYAAAFAAERGYDAFTSSLLVSIYQKHELVKRLGEAAGEAAGLPFYYVDFRCGYEAGKKKSLELGLYRQAYCGCIFSERDRYEPLPKERPGKETAVNKELILLNAVYKVPRLS